MGTAPAHQQLRLAAWAPPQGGRPTAAPAGAPRAARGAVLRLASRSQSEPPERQVHTVGIAMPNAARDALCVCVDVCVCVRVCVCV